MDDGPFGATGDDGSFVPFTDILFNVLLGFTVMVFIALALIRPEARSGIVDVKAEIIVTVNWADGNPDDVDLYVEEPGGNVVWYYIKEAGLIHLDRDDRGNLHDTIEMNGVTVETPLNQETVTMRGLVPGEYVVNVFRYTATTGEPLPVTVKVEKINPSVSVLHYGRVVLARKGDEQTVLRFTLGQDGSVVSTGTAFKSLAQLAIKPRVRSE